MQEQKKYKNQSAESERPKAINEQVSDILALESVENEIIQLANNKLSELILLKNNQSFAEKKAGEPLVRVYRGVNKIDQQLLHQQPYAMRTIVEREGKRKVESMDNLQTEVNMLAQNPTYENLLEYAEKARPTLQPNEVKWLEKDLAKIEEHVLNGRSVRSELNFMQISHGGGVADTGLTPYVSASPDPLEAAKYGKVLLVMDVPLSMISDLNRVDNGEINLKGVVDQKYIKALVPHDDLSRFSDEELKSDLDEALKVLDENIGMPLSAKETLILREIQLAKELEQDKKQQLMDLQLVRQKRVERLIINYPEANIDFNDLQVDLQQRDHDIYSQAKEKVLDYYMARLKKIWPDYAPDLPIEEELEDIAKNVGEKGFDKKNISEALLKKVKQRVELVERKVDDMRATRKARGIIENI